MGSRILLSCHYLFLFMCIYYLIFMMVGIEPRTLCVLDKYFTPEPAAFQSFRTRFLPAPHIPIVRVQRLGEVESLI